MPAGSTVLLDCEVENLGEAFLVSVPPNPVHAAYKWLRTESPEIQGIRTPLPRAVHPQSSLQLKVKVQVPGEPGEYTLRITLVQELVAWFDDLDAGNVCSGQVVVS
jgi:hypothetical protein